MTVEEHYRFIQYIANKANTGVGIGPDDYNMLIPRALDDFFRQRYGLAEDYQPGQPIPRIAWEMTQKIKDDLRPLKTRVDILVTSDGHVAYPSDYVHFSAMSNKYVINQDCAAGEAPRVCEYPFEVVDDDKWSDRLCHPNKAPTQRFPILNYYDDYIQVEPKEVGEVHLTYLRYPLAPHREYTVVNDDDVYLPAGVGVSGIPTAQIELPAITHIQIARYLLSYVGIHLREQELIQHSEAYKQSGVYAT